MIQEFDRVYLQEDLINTPFVKGDVGVVVFIYPANAAYEVEFFGIDGTSLGTETVNTQLLKSVAGIKSVVHIDEAA
jgi:hypothetical protein